MLKLDQPHMLVHALQVVLFDTPAAFNKLAAHCKPFFILACNRVPRGRYSTARHNAHQQQGYRDVRSTPHGAPPQTQALTATAYSKHSWVSSKQYSTG
jgi:hypothetical protein